jgi:hypothetical protein
MSSRSWSFEQAYDVIKVARPAVEMNLGFECQLRAYYAGNYDVYLAHQILLRTRIRDLHYLKQTVAVDSVPLAKPVEPPVQLSPEINEWIAKNISASGKTGIVISSKAGLHDSFTCAPRDSEGNIIGSSFIVSGISNGNSTGIEEKHLELQLQHPPGHGHKRSSKEMTSDDLPPPSSIGSDDMDVVTDAEDSISSFRSPVLHSNASSHYSGLSASLTGKSTVFSQNSSVMSGIDTQLEESIDSAVTALSTEGGGQPGSNSRPNSSNSARKSLTLLPPTHQKSAFGLGNNEPSDSPSLSAPVYIPSTSGFSGSSFSTGQNASGGSFRRHKHARSNRNGVPATPSIGGGGGLPQTVTPEIGTKNPICNLSCPGSNRIRVIPPLRGLEREFKCSWCNVTLFQLANVIRIDLSDDMKKMNEMLEKYYASLECMTNNNSSSLNNGFGSKEDELTSQFMMMNSGGVSHQTDNQHSTTKSVSFHPYNANVMSEYANEIITPRGSRVDVENSNSTYSSSFFKPNSLLPPITGITKNHSSNRSFSADVNVNNANNSSTYSSNNLVSRSYEMEIEGNHNSSFNNSNSNGSHSGSSSSLHHHHQQYHHHRNNSGGSPADSNGSPENSNNIHFSSSFKHTGSHSSLGFGFEDPTVSASSFPMPLSTSKASTSRNRGFNFDMMDSPPSNNNTSGSTATVISVGIAAAPLSTPRARTGSGAGTGVNDSTVFALPVVSMTPRGSRNNETNTSNSNGGGITPRRLPAIDGNFVESPRLQVPPPIVKRQGSASNIPSNQVNSVPKQVPALSTRKQFIPPNATLGPPYNANPNAVLGYDESPRLMIPPHRQQQILQSQGVINSNDYSQYPLASSLSSPSSAAGRPKSAEKRRWLARVNLLTADYSNHSAVNFNAMNKVKNLAEADELVSSSIVTNEGKYYYIEYMEWMGKELFAVDRNVGDICCPGCKNAVGSWSWTPSQRVLLDGRLEAPLFRIHRHVVHQVCFVFAFVFSLRFVFLRLTLTLIKRPARRQDRLKIL